MGCVDLSLVGVVNVHGRQSLASFHQLLADVATDLSNGRVVKCQGPWMDAQCQTRQSNSIGEMLERRICNMLL